MCLGLWLPAGVRATGPSGEPLARDAFQRSTAAGWGVADLGGSWTVAAGAAGEFSTAALEGHMTLPEGEQQLASLADVDARDVDAVASFRLGGTEPTTFVGHALRRQEDGSTLRFTLLTERNTVLLRVEDEQATRLGPDVSTGLEAPAAGKRETYRLRAQMIGARPTTVRARVWADGSEEPAVWHVDETTTLGPADAGALAVQGYSSSGAGVVSVGAYVASTAVSDEAGREAPDRQAPDRQAPDREAPDREAPDREAPEREQPKGEAPDREAPEHEQPKGEAPVRPTPGHSAARPGRRDAANLEVAIDYETGDFSQCATMYAPSDEKPSVVTRTHEGTTPRAGRYMGKFPAADGGDERTQCNGPGIHRQGEYDYIGGSTLVERTQFPCPGPWLHSLFFEPHQDGTGQPAWTMEHRDCGYTIRSNGTGDTDALAPLERGRWQDYVIYVKWSNRDDGHVTVWHKLAGDDEYTKVHDRRQQTITSGKDMMYWVNGYYRNPEVDGYGVVYNDEVRIGKSFEAVDPDPRIVGKPG